MLQRTLVDCTVGDTEAGARYLVLLHPQCVGVHLGLCQRTVQGLCCVNAMKPLNIPNVGRPLLKTGTETCVYTNMFACVGIMQHTMMALVPVCTACLPVLS